MPTPVSWWRYLLVTAILVLFAGAFYIAAFGLPSAQVDAQDFVDLQQGSNPHEGFRRAHAKGFCIAGDFVSSGALAQYSNAPMFAATTTPLLGRISIAGNNPLAPDLKAPVRSLALSIATSSTEVWRTAMNTPPVMAVRNPQDFYQQLQALGNGTIQQFFAEHPESAAFRAWAADYQQTSSFATEVYNSINAFYLINDVGTQQAVRWQAVPRAAADHEIPAEFAGSDDALQNEFAARLAADPVIFDLVFTLAEPGDDEADPTVLWPDARQQIVAGQLVIRDMTPQADGACNAINFDPMVLPTGMAATADKILRARSAAYAESYRRRAREQ
ncbi:catalase family peroxidase [Pseudidiomarina sp.]|uniref:catalase family peroxidase n=1 Tax=Pseudidiomarina sp. TaxID=2081707 RepID=UPI003A97B25B